MSRSRPSMDTRRIEVAGWALFLVLGVISPLVTTSGYYLHLEVLVMIYLLLILGMHVLSGLSGQISFGQSAFMAVGAYAGGLSLVNLHVPYVVGALLAVGSSVLLAVLLGPVLVKLLGDYFVIATIALLMIVYLVSLNWVGLTGGPLGLSGVPLPSIGGWKVESDTQFYYMTLVVDALILMGVINLGRSRIGRTLASIRDDPLVAQSFGVRVRYYKVLVLAMSAGVAGLSGLFFGSYASYLNPASFDYSAGVMFAIIIIIGGLGSLPGAIVGTVVITLSPELLRGLGNWRLVLYGAILSLLMMFRPQGLLGKNPHGQEPMWTRILGRLGRNREIPLATSELSSTSVTTSSGEQDGAIHQSEQ
jgi:branched-chain amino acid transport system permease protein